MGKLDLTRATRPQRTVRETMLMPEGNPFRDRMPPSARRHIFIRQQILWPAGDPPVNPERHPVEDPVAGAREVKRLATQMGAEAVGVAAYDTRFVFTDAEERDHTRVVVFGMSMSYDCMIDIGPRSQAEVHRVYYRLDDLANRLTHQIAAFGYRARSQTNIGDFPLPAYGYLAGLGELGKHGSLISPALGPSFRLGAISTDMPLAADGPRDFGIDEICVSCNICSRFCPGEAIPADKQLVNGVVRWHVDTPACQPWFYKMHGCKICLMVCPFNARTHLKEPFDAVAQDIRRAKDAPGLVDIIEARTAQQRAEGDVDPDGTI